MNILDEFYEKEVEPRLEQIKEELEQDFHVHHLEWIEQLKPKFEAICCVAKNIQEKNHISIGYLMFHVLRTRLMEHDYRYQVVIYGEEFYAKEGFFVGDIDVSFIYQYYEKLWQVLLTEYKKYIGKITPMDIEQIMLRLLDEFHTYVVELLRCGLLDFLETTSYLMLEKASDFHIESGELMEPGNVIHMEQKEKSILKVLKWLDQKKEDAYCFSDFRGLHFQDVKFQGLDLRYVDFRESNLEGSHFSVCMFCGTKFRDCNMKRANLMISVIAGADFTRADLTGANLENCVSYTGKKILNNWKKVGYTHTSFRESNLTNTNFRGAVLHGVDFRESILTGADFTGASLFGSKFSKSSLAQCNLPEGQLEQIVVM